MGRLMIFIATLLFAVLAGCGRIREKSAEELLESAEMRRELYTAILQDRDYTAELRDLMKERRPGHHMKAGVMAGDSDRLVRCSMMDDKCARLTRKSCCCCSSDDAADKDEKTLRK
jgi:hypothetical protein